MAMTSEEQSWLNNSISERTNDAHRRFMRGRANFIESNPAAVSSWERQSTLGRARELEDREGLRDHELAMLRKQGENDLKVAEQKAWGMQHQGESAADENRRAAMHSADMSLEVEKERQRGLTEQERLRADRDRELRTIDGLNSLDLANTQGEWNLKAQQEATKAAQARADAEANAKARDEAARIQKALIDSGAKIDAARINAAAKQIATQLGLGKTYDDLRSQYADDPEMLKILGAYEGGSAPGEGTTTTTVAPVSKWKR